MIRYFENDSTSSYPPFLIHLSRMLAPLVRIHVTISEHLGCFQIDKINIVLVEFLKSLISCEWAPYRQTETLGYRCKCKEGFYGWRCELHACMSDRTSCDLIGTKHCTMVHMCVGWGCNRVAMKRLTFRNPFLYLIFIFYYLFMIIVQYLSSQNCVRLFGLR